MRIIDRGIYTFDENGVLVRVPPELSNIIAREEKIDWTPEMWQQEDFHPVRLVMNLKLVDVNNPDATQLTFDTPVQVQVYYTHFERSEALKRALKLAYWHNNRWNLIDPVIDVYPVLSRGWAGFLQFEIPEWGDPAIALGL